MEFKRNNNLKDARSKKKLSYEERIKIEIYLKIGMKKNKIAEILGRDKKIIYREIKRNSNLTRCTIFIKKCVSVKKYLKIKQERYYSPAFYLLYYLILIMNINLSPIINSNYNNNSIFNNLNNNISNIIDYIFFLFLILWDGNAFKDIKFLFKNFFGFGI